VCRLFNEKLIASSSDECTIRIWNWVEDICYRTLYQHETIVKKVIYLDELDILASVGGEGHIVFWHYGKMVKKYLFENYNFANKKVRDESCKS
jgi:WD40 repeat protein